MDIALILLLSGLSGLFLWMLRKKSFVRPAGRAIFISGCDTGIGKKLAEYFSEMGCLVFAGCLDPSSSSLPDGVRVVPLNIREVESVEKAVASVRNMLANEGKELWALVNNAGVCVYGHFEWQTPRQRNWQLQVNIDGTLSLTYAFLPLLKRSAGRIITITSVNGKIPYPGLAVYSATKAALRSFSDALRVELLPRHGVRVITVEPGDYARVTSIMAKHKEHAREMWENIPSEERESIRHEFERYHSVTLQNYGLTSPTSWEGSPLLRDMKEAVLSESPSHNYLSTPFHHKIVYKLLASVPQCFRDFIMIKISKCLMNSADTGTDSLLPGSSIFER